MRMGPFYLVFLFAICFASTGGAQPAPLPGNVNVMQTDNSSGLPSGVTMTATYIEPGVNRLTLHFEASPTAPLVTNKLVDVYAGNSLNAIYRISVSVVAASPFPCSVPSLLPIDQSTQAVLLSNLTPGCSVEVWAGDSSGAGNACSEAMRLQMTPAWTNARRYTGIMRGEA